MAGQATQQAAWDGAVVRTWLERRIVAARTDQAMAERAGRAAQDDCDKATAEEMVCTLCLKDARTTDAAEPMLAMLRALLDRDDYIGRGVYDDTRFDRHVRAYIRKLVKMTKTNDGFANVARYQ